MRISDWSSDVCSSDLDAAALVPLSLHGFSHPPARMGGQLPDCTIEDPGFRHFCGLHAWAGHPRLSGGGNALYRAISAFGGGCLCRTEQSYRFSMDQPALYLCAPRGGVAFLVRKRVG